MCVVWVYKGNKGGPTRFLIGVCEHGKKSSKEASSESSSEDKVAGIGGGNKGSAASTSRVGGDEGSSATGTFLGWPRGRVGF